MADQVKPAPDAGQWPPSLLDVAIGVLGDVHALGDLNLRPLVCRAERLHELQEGIVH